MSMHRFHLLLTASIVYMLFVCSLAFSEVPPGPIIRSFDRSLNLDTAPTTSASASVGDLNSDGFLDIVLARGRHWPESNQVLFGDGAGNFAGVALGPSPDRTYSAALADLNGDGSLDMVISNDRPDQKRIYFNDGKGNFTETGGFGEPEWPTRYVTLADLNADGHPDIIAANRNGAKSTNATPSFVCFNDGSGRFPDYCPLPTQSSTTVAAADFDGDGSIDLFTPHRDGGPSKILWNDSQGRFNESSILGPKASRTRVAVAADLNGDGVVDLVVGGDDGKGTLIYINQAKRQFGGASPLSAPDRVAFSAIVSDLNRDGTLDIVVGYDTGRSSVFFNDGSGHRFVETAWNDGVGAVYGLAVGDFNGDGWPDIVTARSEGLNAIWFSEPIKDETLNASP